LLTLEILLQVIGHITQLLGRQTQAADRRAQRLGRLLVHQGRIFIHPPDQPVAHRNGLTGTKRHQALAATQGNAVLDKRRIAIGADAIGVFNRLVCLTGHAGLQVLAQLGIAHHTVLEKIVVLDLGVIVGHHSVQIAMAPAQVMAQHQRAGSVGILILIVWSDVGHIGLYRGKNT